MAKVNAELLRADLKGFGITQEQLGKRLGFSRAWLGNFLKAEEVEEKKIRMIEDALFKPAGYYEIIEEPAKEQEARRAEAPAQMGELIALIAEIGADLKIIRAQNEEIIGALHSMQEERKEQHEEMIQHCKGHSTQIMKVRSAIERSAEKEGNA